MTPKITLELIEACSLYCGGGYFIKSDATPDNPSPLLRAAEVRDFLLNQLKEATQK